MIPPLGRPARRAAGGGGGGVPSPGRVPQREFTSLSALPLATPVAFEYEIHERNLNLSSNDIGHDGGQ